MIILFTTIVNAVEFKKIYEGEIKNSGEIKIDNKIFKVYIIHTSSYDRVKVTFPSGQSYLMPRYETIHEQPYYFSVENITQGKDTEFDIATQSYPYYAQINITKAEAEIEIERDFSKTSFSQGETVIVNVRLENTGTEHAFDAIYTDNYGENFSVTDCNRCEIKRKKVIWEGDLNINKVVDFSYKIKALKELTFNSLGEIRVNNASKESTKKLTITAPKLELDTIFTPSTPQLEEKTQVEINIRNEDDYNITSLTYKLYLPDSFYITKKTYELNRGANYLLLQTAIKAGENISISLTLIPRLTGNFEIKEELEYRTEITSDTLTYTRPMKIDAEGLIIYILGNDTIHEGDTGTINVMAKNMDKITYSNINMNFQTDLPSPLNDVMINSVLPGKDETASTYQISIPSPAKEEYTINISSTYITKSGELLENFYTKTINVIKKQEQKNPKNTNNGGGEMGGVGGIGGSSGGSTKKESSFVRISKNFGNFAVKPIGIASIAAILTLIIIVYIIYKRTKQEIMEDITDQKLE